MRVPIKYIKRVWFSQTVSIIMWPEGVSVTSVLDIAHKECIDQYGCVTQTVLDYLSLASVQS